jgi:hypothetical protein
MEGVIKMSQQINLHMCPSNYMAANKTMTYVPAITWQQIKPLIASLPLLTCWWESRTITIDI